MICLFCVNLLPEMHKLSKFCLSKISPPYWNKFKEKWGIDLKY